MIAWSEQICVRLLMCGHKFSCKTQDHLYETKVFAENFMINSQLLRTHLVTITGYIKKMATKHVMKKGKASFFHKFEKGTTILCKI